MSDDFEFSVAALRKKHRAGNGSHHANGNGTGDREKGQFQNGFEDESDEQRRDFGGTGGWTRPNRPRDQSRFHEHRAPRELRYPQDDQAVKDEGFRLPFDPWRFVAALKRNWLAVVLSSFVLGILFFVIASQFLDYKVTVSLWRRETSNAFRTADPNGQSSLPREMSEQTLFKLMRSSEVLRRVSEKSSPHVSMDHLAKSVAIVPTTDPDILTVTIAGRGDMRSLVKLANLYAFEVVGFTKDIQKSESGDVNIFLKKRLAEMDAEVALAKANLAKFSRDAGVLNYEKDVDNYVVKLAAIDSKLRQAEIDRDTIDSKIKGWEVELGKQTPTNDKLEAAREELDNLKLKYTEANPLVIAQHAKIEQILKQSSTTPTSPVTSKAPGTVIGNGIYMQILELQAQRGAGKNLVDALTAEKNEVAKTVGALTTKAAQYGQLKAQVQSLETTRATLADRQRQMELWVTDALGYYRLYSDATLADVNRRSHWIKVFLIGWAGALLGLLGAASVVMIAEVVDTRLKTAADVLRVTGLPVFATLGDLAKMDPSAQVNWAFRTLTLLKGKLSESNDQGLVCGIISSVHGEGRSTWVNLLVSAASQRGLRVLTVDTRPTSVAPEAQSPIPNDPVVTTLTTNVLATPSQVTTQLIESKSQPIVHIPLPGWVWNLERRKQWQSALAQWRRIDNLVLLVELPPASQSESLLLAENLPQILWLVGSGMADAGETKEQLETFRQARCNIVGAVLNRAPDPIVRHRVTRWFTKVSVFFAMLTLGTAFAAESGTLPSPIPVPTHVSFSARKPIKRAAWQEHLTLGPGDSVDISVFGYPELTRTNIFVGPDGRFSYLQLQDFPVTGLSIDELRARLDQELSKYYTTGARTIVTPVAFQSKKYYVLGKVAVKGVFTLDRPLTIVEAVARAKGLETGLYERNTVELADLSRAVLIRKGVRLPVDFEKLFLEGDLTQNVQIEPGDYLYFPGAAANEIFVLGEVMNPGPLGFTPSATLVAALTDRGGFSERAFKKRILVIRGSLNQPETFAVDAAAILTARAPDFKLEPKDIVYVSSRPWIKIEELLDDATQSFIQAAVTTWAGAYIGPIITQPIIPHP